ncbi:hypothetical protein, partial [Mycobacterium canettii]|uniref:hypothetical protein n=1 Tax=Mycobacterium canetti TaxID=78331 RepID=UPI0022A9F367
MGVGPLAGIGPLLGAHDGWPVGAAWMGGGVTVGMVGGCAVTAAVPGRVDSWLRRRMSAAWSWS